MLRDIQQALDSYEKTYKSESKWLRLLENQIRDYERAQAIYKQQRAEFKEKYTQQKSTISTMDDDINELKNTLDPVAVNNHNNNKKKKHFKNKHNNNSFL